jgi:hypothetical protein
MSDIQLAEPEFVDGDAVDPPAAHKPGSRGTVVTISTVIALLVATALTVLGLGASDNAVQTVDASSWLWSSSRGEVDHVNGVTARVDTRTKITDAQNHEIQITQNDRYLILRDLETGQVTALDLTTLQVSAVMPSTPGYGVSVELYRDTAIVVDGVQGVVRQLDPRTLSPVGEPVTLRRGIVAGGFDGVGALWVALPTEGTVVAIEPGIDGQGPHVVRTQTVADPGHDLVLSSLDSGVAVLDNTTQRLAVVTDRVETVDLPTRRPGTLPPHTAGRPIAVTVPTERAVLLVDGRSVHRVAIPGDGEIGPAVAYAGRIYVPDPDAGTGVVRETTESGAVVNTITVPSPTGRVELEVREDYLFINSPDGSQARVVDSDHHVRNVNKYQDGVLGGDPPPPPPRPKPEKPAVTIPGRPQAVTATAGDGTVTITWRKAAENGAPITQYVVEGNGDPIIVGASQRQVEITGLTNGQKYRFFVHAVNAIGPGPRAFTRTVIPTRDVPDPPATVAATANPDGSVAVTWPAANGQGHKITQYRVTSVSGAGVTASVGAVKGTKMTIADGTLTYGTQYAFMVVAINDIDAGSTDSPPSNTVIPFTVPTAPGSVVAATSPAQRGAIDVRWQAAQGNGRPIDRYEVVQADGTVTPVTTTTTTLSGFPDDTAVQVKVRAVNEAGAGPEVTVSGRTMAAPSLTVTTAKGSYNSVSLTITPNAGGGTGQCTFTVTGAGSVTQACTTTALTLTMKQNVWPNGSYQWKVSLTNAVGAVSTSSTAPGRAPIATNTLLGTSICGDLSYCPDGAVYYSGPQQIDADALGHIAVGKTFTPQCWTRNGPVINNVWGGKPGGGNPDRLQNNYWLKTSYGGHATAYFPWVWTKLDGGDSVSMLPQC